MARSEPSGACRLCRGRRGKKKNKRRERTERCGRGEFGSSLKRELSPIHIRAAYIRRKTRRDLDGDLILYKRELFADVELAERCAKSQAGGNLSLPHFPRLPRPEALRVTIDLSSGSRTSDYRRLKSANVMPATIAPGYRKAIWNLSRALDFRRALARRMPFI